MKKVQSLVLFALLLLTFCQTEAFAGADTLRLSFKNTVDNESIELGKVYTNYFGENFTIRAFKYYISNVKLLDNQENVVYQSRDVFLINEAEEASKYIALAIPTIKFNKIQFLLGVDSIRNTGGVQTGDLDPAKGMFWVWNTGYIMAKLEGNSPAAKTPGHLYTYDIGGYKKDENAARVIELEVPDRADIHNITISANAAKWFKNINEIRIAENPTCHASGELAMKIADNYANMFSIGAK